MGLEIGFSFAEPAFRSNGKPRIEPGPTPASPELMTIKLPELPVLSPKEAFASEADLGRPTTPPSKVHTEIKVNGKVVARVFNSGGVVIADEYRFLS